MANFPRAGDDFGGYRIVERIGAGGMGVVFRAEQLAMGRRQVALKVLSPAFVDDPELRARFTREAETLTALDSPHITTIFDAGEHEGCLYLATQFVSGGDLHQTLNANGPMRIDAALAVCSQLASALADAHAAGVIHRDVKPSNVLLRSGGDVLHAYLCDFGIARTQGDNLTQSGMIVGTYGYLAPERIKGAPATAATDIYSVGCVLVAAITGTAPYSGTDVEVANQHLTAPIPQLPSGDRAASEINRVLRRAMAKDPSERYASALVMQRDLQRVRGLLGNAVATEHSEAVTLARPVPADPPASRSGTLVERAPRRRSGVLLGSLVLLLVAGVGAALGATQPWQDEGSDSARPPQATPSVTTTADLTDPKTRTPSRAKVEAPTSEATSAPTSASVTCWDGSRVSRGECSAPVGEAGMRWVFPSLNRDFATCHAGYVYAEKTDVWQCDKTLAGQETETIYARWSDQQAMLDHYRHKYGNEVRNGDVLFFGPTFVKWQIQYSAAFVDQPFSVTIQGGDGDDALVKKAMAQVSFRTSGEFAP